ncbi:MAG: SpoIIE family protein phosphatase [Magnetococcales bacterium]|nr:SpoIIE family protein phosphatase [Magnetococcales bacterium]
MVSNRVGKPVVLVVDDTPENIDILKGALSQDYSIKPAINGATALRIAAALPQPDLVLLDIMMPEMDGHQVCQRLKAHESTRDIPVIFVTAMSKDTDELLGLQLGAVDYITKPFSIPIVQARIKTHLALRTAHRALDHHNQLLLQERRIIESIILKMRQADVVDQRYLNFLVAPVERTAGDMLMATFTPDGRQLVMLGDFTGHGLSAAIGGPLVTYILHDMARHNASGNELLQAINQQLCARLPANLFFAAALLEVSPDRGQIQLWNAGLPEGLLLRHEQLLARLPSQLPPLGIMDPLDISSASTTVMVQPEDRCYLFSDGIIEARSQQNEMFGVERLQLFLAQLASGHCTIDELTRQLVDYTGSVTFEDDVTLVEVIC